MSRSGGGFFRTLVAGGVIVVGLVIVAGFVGINLLPFGTETKDHSPPPILHELRELADFHGAQAQFEVVVDTEEDVRFMPQFLAGERVQFVAIGTVDAVIDLSGLSGEAVRYDADRNSATVLLPAPRIEDPVIDHEQSHVMNRDRGLFNRIGGVFSDNPTGERALYLAAEAKMSAAAAQTGLTAKAEQTTEQLLEDMIANLGVDEVDVRFYDGELPACEGSGCP
jgi:Protein of unknown function (DUF4230)